STEDRQEDPPRLSVWAEQLTRAEQAWRLMGEKAHYRLALRLNVDAVRTLRPDPDSSELPNLDVEWYPLHAEDGSPDTRPGADGHAGIVGLHLGSSAQRKSLRRKLAQLASEGVHWIADEPPSTERGP